MSISIGQFRWIGALARLLVVALWLVPGLARAEAIPEATYLEPLPGETREFPDGWRPVGGERPPGSIVWVFENPEGLRVRVTAEERDTSKNAYGRTLSFNILYRSEGSKGAVVRSLMDEFVRRVAHHDDGRLSLVRERLGELSADVSEERERLHPPGMPGDIDPVLYRRADAAERLLARVFLIVALLGLLTALYLAFRTLASRPVPEAAFWGGVLLAGLLLRLLLEPRMVMTFSGYSLIEQAVHFGALKKYGAGAPLLYHSLIRLFPHAPDLVYLTANAVFGWLLIVLSSAWAQRYLATRYVGAAVALVLAFSPLLVKDHLSESNLVPTMMLVFAGLLLMDAWRRSASSPLLVLAAGTFVFAILCRPLMILLIPLAVLFTELQRADARLPRFPARSFALVLAAAGLVLLPHVFFLMFHYRGEMATGNAAGFAAWLGNPLDRFFSEQNLFLRYDATPLVLPLLFAPALARAGVEQMRRLIAIGLSGFVFFTVYFVDMPPPSLPRLEAPAILWFSLISGFGLALLWQEGPWRRIAWRQGLLGLVFAFSCLVPVTALWERDNDWEEHRMLLSAAAALPEDARYLGRLGVNDQPTTWGVFRTYPDYFFRRGGEWPRLVILDRLGKWLDAHRQAGLDVPGGVYVYLGMRCYALVTTHIPEAVLPANVHPDAATPGYEHPLCAGFRRDYELVPVVEEFVPNRDLPQRFLWYPPRPELQMGLYRIVGFREGS